MTEAEIRTHEGRRVKVETPTGPVFGKLLWHILAANPTQTYVRLNGKRVADPFDFDKISLAGNTETNCRSEEGITVGLIDSMLSIAQLLKDRDMTSEAIQEALIDLQDDAAVSWLLSDERIKIYEHPMASFLEYVEELATNKAGK